MAANQSQQPETNHSEALRVLEYESKSSGSFTSDKRNSQLLRLLRLQPAFILLLSTLFDKGEFLDFQPPLIFTTILIFWELICFVAALNRFPTIPIEVTLVLELTFFGFFLYLSIQFSLGVGELRATEGWVFGAPWEDNGLLLRAVICFLILSTTAVYIYFDLRAYPAHWRYKRDCRKIKPILVFTDAGNPVAVFPPTQSIVQRLSIDSLQQDLTDLVDES